MLQQFVESLVQSGLMTADEVSRFEQGLPPQRHPEDAQALARELVQGGKLTKYQAQMVYQGKPKGLVFGEYTVLDKLGQGGMGVVLKAQHRRMKRVVAVKVLPASAMKSSEAVKRFYREAEAAAKLNHPNIVQAHDASESEGIHYLVMEYVDGKDLAAIVRERGPLEVKQALDCILQAAKGLEYAHREGVIHRDIKPGNLLLDKKGTVKILDMGLARVALAVGAEDPGSEQLTQSGQVLGTCDYMAPEQAQDTRRADQRSDIYSLGCTLYRLLTGKVPYSGDSLMSILLAHRDAPIPSLSGAGPDVPESVNAIFQKMVAKRPEDRYQSMGEVIADVEACLGSSTRLPVVGLAEESLPPPLPQNLAFLQDAAPVASVTTQRQGTAAEDTLRRVAQDDTDKSMSGRLKRAMATAGCKPLVMLGVAGGTAVLMVLVALVLSPSRPTREPEAGDSLNKSTASAVNPSQDAAAEFSGLSQDFGPGDQNANKQEPPLAVAPFDAAQARKHQEAWAKHLGVPVEESNSIGMKFALIPPGESDMGPTQEEVDQLLKEAKEKNYGQWYMDGLSAEAPRHRVRLTKPFYLGACEVTVGAFGRFVDDTGYKTDAEKDGKGGIGLDGKGGLTRKPEFVWRSPHWPQTDAHPVVCVSWNDTAAFCRWLSRKEGKEYRLPTEAEWEYACRAGSTKRYSFGDDATSLGDYAWYGGNSGNKAHPVGEKTPNAWRLYDMEGNVGEWCADWFAEESHPKSMTNDPVGPDSGASRVWRGGGWADPYPGLLRCACRFRELPDNPSVGLGFRVVRTLTP